MTVRVMFRQYSSRILTCIYLNIPHHQTLQRWSHYFKTSVFFNFNVYLVSCSQMLNIIWPFISYLVVQIVLQYWDKKGQHQHSQGSRPPSTTTTLRQIFISVFLSQESFIVIITIYLQNLPLIRITNMAILFIYFI